MNKNCVLTVITFLCSICLSFGQASDLIISEYAEGSSFNKYLEIYNGTGSAIDLSNYEVWKITNGGAWPEDTITLSGTLADGSTYVIANPTANATILAAADLTSTTSWNGDDAVGLAKDILGTFTLIDVIGIDGPDPGTGWDVAGTNNATANHTLIRKTSICAPNTNWTASSGTSVADSEWVVFAQDYNADIGNHSLTCTDTVLSFVTTSSSVVENGVSIDVCVSITNPSATVSATVDITLDVSSSATNGADYDDGASSAISFPQTFTFPANSNANQCLTIFMADDLFYEDDETVVLNLSNPTGGSSAFLGSNIQHVLTITENETPVIADVLITEIMYNSVGVDDEWIEICNLSGVDQILNDYSVAVNGTTRYTFPSSGVTLLDGDCLLVELGNNGDANFNPGCVFTTPYSSGLSSGILSNTSATITIVADDNTTIVDSVIYDDGDGADGNGFSLHFNTNASDNSNTNTDWQEVADAGSPGINSLISQCGTPAADINIANNSFNTIPDGSPAAILPYNTVFAATPIGNSTTAKTYYITNEGNIDLDVTSISLDTGTNFSLQNLPTLPLTITPTDAPIAFEVVFNPQSPIGTKLDVVRIVNSDPDAGEADYTFQVQGEAECAASAITISPSSGPTGTIVTVTGTNLSTATATFNGTPAAFIDNISSTVMEVTVPTGALSGSLEILDGSGCPVTTSFTIIDNQIGSCEGGSSLTELFISEVTDATYGSLTYIEIYNPTSSSINLANYEIRVYSNGTNGTEIPSSSANPAPSVQQLSGTLNAGQTFVLTTGTFGALGNNLCSVPGGDGSLGDQNSTTIAGVNITAGGHDFIGLYQVGDGISDPPVDAFGVFGDDDWMNALGTSITGTRGFNFRRLNSASPLPSSTFDETQWNIIDWAGQGDSACVSNNDYGNIGVYDFSTGTPPINIVGASSSVTFCDQTATISASGDEGVTGGLPIAYQWYEFAPGDPMGWVELSDSAVYSGSTTNTLNVSDTFGLDNYQYYCQIRENTNTCYTASDAIRLITKSTTWTSPGVWTNGIPDINTTTVLNFDYDTATEGSFSACSLTINSGILNIRNGDFVEIENDLIVNSTLDIETEGSLIMIDDLGTVTNNGTTNVRKTTTDMETFDYTYWSSPIDYSSAGTTAQTVLTGFRADRIFSFNTSQFFDVLDAAGNAGADGFDDDQNAWTNHNSFMNSGLGYAAMSTGTGVHQRTIIFSGRLNTGIIPVAVSLSQNGADVNDDWNLLGNPYPSSIFVDDFIAHNTNLSGTVYLWTHEDDISIANPGPNAYNFNSNDYAMYNSVGGVGTASTGTVVSNIPTGYIASGQGFFVDAISSGTVEFTNDMRDTTYNNDDFFRNSQANSLTNINEKDRMWLNLTNPDGAFSQILVGYMEDGTLGKDRLYDGVRLNGSNYIDFYSKDSTGLYNYGIQGRPPFTIVDRIPLGYDSNLLGELTISLYRAEGLLNDVTVYLKDNFLNTIHDLSNSDYSFNTENGSFVDRFEILFQLDTLSIDDNQIDPNQLSIVELQNGTVKFTIGSKHLTIRNIEIIDLLGRTLYHLKGNTHTETYDLQNLSQTTYIAKVSLSNGQTITKRALKRN